MLTAIKKFFQESIDTGTKAAADHSVESLQVATCALLLEVAHADEVMDAEEQKTLIGILQKEYSLTSELVDDLISMAEEQRRQSISYWEFGKTINASCTVADKEKILEYLWHVVFADKKLAGHEDAFMRKCAGMLKLPHDALIRAKLRAMES